jgi:hypothetical protein
MLSGGTLNLHGNRTNTWTKLAKTAEAGTNSIEVIRARQSVAPLPPSTATRSRSTSRWSTCTSARSPSMWISAAKWAC